jgi:protein-S-isoprenylcysteine O-methyltransferase Ste14
MMAKAGLLAIAAVSFVVYAHAIRYLFSRDHGIDGRMRVLQIAGTISAVIHVAALATSSSTGPRASTALFVYMAGLFLFFWAKRSVAGQRLTLAFSKDIPAVLVTRGVFRYVRHPFYLAYTLTWIAGLVAAPSLWTGGSAASMLAIYVYAANAEEAKFSESGLSGQYEAYRLRAGLLWPRLCLLRNAASLGQGSKENTR